jgi:hypothetical protein
MEVPAMTDEGEIELERVLSAISYPCDKAELLRRARADSTDDEVLARLELLPDRIYEGADEALMFADDSERYQSGDPLT